MERRSLFQMMFGRKPRADTIYNQLKLLNGYNAVFTTWGNDPYSADVVRGAVDAIARNAALIAKGDDAGFQNKTHLAMEAAGFADVKRVGDK